MEIRLNAFDKDSSASHSNLVMVSNKEELLAEFKRFSEEVPFHRWYTDHENVDGSDETDQLLKEVESEI